VLINPRRLEAKSFAHATHNRESSDESEVLYVPDGHRRKFIRDEDQSNPLRADNGVWIEKCLYNSFPIRFV
jgi:hypothetical protein